MPNRPRVQSKIQVNGTRSTLSASAAAGLVGGLVASWLMVEFQHRIWPPLKGGDGESSTSKLAKRLVELRNSKSLTSKQAKMAGKLIHYGLGAGLGLLYGASASLKPVVASGVGLPFGIATEIVVDQTLVPALGLSGPFWEYPAVSHFRGLAAHLIFGLGTEGTRQLLLRIIAATTPIALNPKFGDR